MCRELTILLTALMITISGGTAFDGSTAKAQANAADQLAGSGILDGLTFSGQILRDGKPVVDVVDKWVFDEGTFLSTECAVRCNYPRAPYFIRKQGAAVEFVSESRCADMDATIVWRGTIEDQSIKGFKKWTIKRWYWTIVKEFEFEGSLSVDPLPVAGN